MDLVACVAGGVAGFLLAALATAYFDVRTSRRKSAAFDSLPITIGKMAIAATACIWIVALLVLPPLTGLALRGPAVAILIPAGAIPLYLLWRFFHRARADWSAADRV